MFGCQGRLNCDLEDRSRYGALWEYHAGDTLFLELPLRLLRARAPAYSTEQSQRLSSGVSSRKESQSKQAAVSIRESSLSQAIYG